MLRLPATLGHLVIAEAVKIRYGKEIHSWWLVVNMDIHNNNNDYNNNNNNSNSKNSNNNNSSNNNNDNNI